MKSESRFRSSIVLVARWLLGAVFLYQGLAKALQPVEFLKLLREYNLFENHVALNAVAALLPWFEVFCGLLLISGVAVSGTALVSLAMLLPFTWLVADRAWATHLASGIPLCAVKFDCGCGTGEVIICRKLVENAALMLLACVALFGGTDPWRLGERLRRSEPHEPFAFRAGG